LGYDSIRDRIFTFDTPFINLNFVTQDEQQ
jgi:hypothetical protein